MLNSRSDVGAWADTDAEPGGLVRRWLGRFGHSQKKEGSIMKRHLVLGAILVVALVAFEFFNFDTTQYALDSLLGGITFLGVGWATILAIAFCGIDFAGLSRLFTPSRGDGEAEPSEAWYLMGAWFLAAGMNAIMTWWAVSLVVLQHPIGNEILDREEILHIVPVFVAVLVWLTRVLIIAALTIAGERVLRPTVGAGTRSNGRRAGGGAHIIGGEREPAYAPARAMPSGPRPAPKPASAASQGMRSGMMAAAMYDGGQALD